MEQQSIRVNLPDGRVVHFPATMSEADITAAVSSLASSQQEQKPESAPKPEASGLQRVAQTVGGLLPNPVGIAKGIRGAFRRENLPTVGAMGGAVLGGLIGNVPGAIAGAGIGGGLGKGGEIMAAETAGVEVPQTASGVFGAMAKRGAGEAALQAVGGIAGKGLQSLGRGAYRFALRPANKVLAKHHGVVEEGLRRAAPVSAKGVAKVADLRGRAISEKDAALAMAGNRVSILTKPLVDDTTHALSGQADEMRRAGLGDPSEAWRNQGSEIVANNPKGLAPAELEQIKRTHDNRLGGAFRKIRDREPLAPDEQFGVKFVDRAREAQEAITPGYKAANKEIMALSGLEAALRNRVEGSAGNDALANLGLMFGGLSAAPARIATMPAVSSRIGIAADRTGQKVTSGLPMAVRTALLKLLDDKQ